MVDLLGFLVLLILLPWLIIYGRRQAKQRTQAYLEYQNRVMSSGINEIDQMDGKTFEYKLALHFQRRGFYVETTPSSGDYGADLILTDGAGYRTVVQAKRYSSNVGVKAIQEVLASMPIYGASFAMVVTNSYFTKNAITLANSAGVVLLDRDRLIHELTTEGIQDTPPMNQVRGETPDVTRENTPDETQTPLPVILEKVNQTYPQEYLELGFANAQRAEIRSRCSKVSDEHGVLEHALISGPSFQGDRELALFIASHFERRLFVAISECFSEPRQVVWVLTNIREGEILYIPEPHFSEEVEDLFIKAINSYTVSFPIGLTPDARVVTLDLPSFTLICSHSDDYDGDVSERLLDHLRNFWVIDFPSTFESRS